MYWVALFVIASIGLIYLLLEILTKKNNNVFYVDIHEKSYHFDKELIKKIKELAKTHTPVHERGCKTWMYKSIRKEWRVFKKNYEEIYKNSSDYEDLVPSLKWIIDNFYIVNREIKILRQSFSKSNCRFLPAIKTENHEIFPRIYVVVREIMRTIGCHFSEDKLLALIEAYQTERYLKISEIWAIPLVLRICFIGNISKTTKKVKDLLEKRRAADRFIDNILDADPDYSELLIRIKEDIKQHKKQEDLNFAAQILYRLKERGLNQVHIMEDIAKVLPCKEQTYDEIIRNEAHNQAKLESEISILIRSLIKITEIDFNDIFEKISLVDEVLSKEKIDVYRHMDLQTKDDYRNEIERIAKRVNTEELKVAKVTLDMTIDKKEKEAHVGYYLIGRGNKELYEKLNYKPSIARRLDAFTRKHKGQVYFVLLAILTSVFSIGASIYTYMLNINNALLYAFITFLFVFIMALEISQDILNSLFLKFVMPKTPPSLDLKNGIGDANKTIIVVPVILGNEKQVNHYLDKIEKTYLANRDSNFSFGIIGDFKDADKRDLDSDEKIIEIAKDGIRKLNKKYASIGTSNFYFFHRYRKWNPKEKKWMGWERKRGKLEEFNRLLLGDGETSYYVIEGSIDNLKGMKYVITIDSDTDLVIESAKKLVGMMAHPLNKPVLNDRGDRVLEGYAIIQPRVDVRLTDYMKSGFSKLFAGQAGIDPYTNAVSDIYQDVFREGIFTGKGIYDISMFHRVLNKQIPENSVLSHDLLEGSYTRCALATKIQLTDGYPSNVLSFYKREHRWIRGDWQLIKFIFSKNPLTLLSKWKMIANLFRSLLPFAILCYVFVFTFLIPWNQYVMGSVFIFMIVFPLLHYISDTLFVKSRKLGVAYTLRTYIASIFLTFSETLIMMSFIPYRAFVALDAIIRTIYRVCFSKERLLEWQTAEMVEKNQTNKLSSYLCAFLPALIVSGGMFALSFISNSIVTMAVSILFSISFLIAYVISRDYKQEELKISDNNREELIKISRDIWRFYEENNIDEYNGLMPDNVQVLEKRVVAKRTSPTNIGLQLLAVLSARDFGFISIYEFFDKIMRTLETIKHLKKWHGHLYNWYDIESLEPLLPKYVSTVDSGNFIGFLMTLRVGVEDVISEPFFSNKHKEGILHTLRLLGYEREEAISLLEDNIQDNLKDLIFKIDSKEEAWFDTNYISFARENISGFINDMENFSDFDKSINDLCKEENKTASLIKNEMEMILREMDEIIRDTRFGQLYDKKRNLFRIGYNETNTKLDDGYYDLMASEARLASFIAIAKGEVPRKHWYQLSRPLTLVHGNPTLLSWSGTMFEYFMPHLILKAMPNTIFYKTLKNVAIIQKKHGRKNKVPFGISESAYYRFDQLLNYQYRAFGIAELGFKSDLGKYLVISPYASLMAVGMIPKAVMKNIEKLKEEDTYGVYGFYEAIDYMIPKNQKFKKPNVIKTFMCHHQGMSLLSIQNYLMGNIMQKRFHKDSMVGASEILLEETKPYGIVIRDKKERVLLNRQTVEVMRNSLARTVIDTKLAFPVTHIMSNDEYQVVLNSSGSGYSKYKSKMINAWENDWINDIYGHFFYIKNIADKNHGEYYYSATYQPTRVEPDKYEVVFLPDHAEFKREDGDIQSSLDIFVSPEENVEIRRLSIKNNNSENFAEFEITTFLELSLDSYQSFIGHKTFSKLFIETEFDNTDRILIATRRSRDENTPMLYFGAMFIAESDPTLEFGYETDRFKFIGRGRSLKNPISMDTAMQLGKNLGEVVDPCIAMRLKIVVGTTQTRYVSCVTCISNDKTELKDILSKYRSEENIVQAKELAFYDSKLEMNYLNIDDKKVNAVLDASANIIYGRNFLKETSLPKPQVQMGQPNLWKFGISGDNPIILVILKEVSELDTLKDTIIAYEYFRRNQLPVDLVVVNKKEEGYYQELGGAIASLMDNIKIFESEDKRPSIFTIASKDISRDEECLLMQVADLVFTGEDRLLGNRIKESRESYFEPIPSILDTNYDNPNYEPRPLMPTEGILKNEFGEFSKDGREYIINLSKYNVTPAPWNNVIANHNFGCLASEAGLGYTFSGNSRENKLTKWENDPVVDNLPEVVYLRNEVSKDIFTITPRPLRDSGQYRIRHGFGYTQYEHNSEGLHQKQTVFVKKDRQFKYVLVELENTTELSRRIEVIYYAKLVLGVTRDQNIKHIDIEFNTTHNFVCAKNGFNLQYPGCAYLYASGEVKDFCGNRRSFIGVSNDQKKPAGLIGDSMTLGDIDVDDPCAVIRTIVDIDPGESRSVVFMLGQEETYDEVISVTKEFGTVETSMKALREIKEYWKKTLSVIQVKTPDKEMNVMLNGWLLYQAIGCRIMARSAYYQSGGAFGFRDQLQDSLALLYNQPEMTRDIIINASKRQFLEGDVLHWWHADTGNGIRTKMSDDLLWLPYVVCKYIRTTDDYSILDIKTPYLEWELLKEDEHERFGSPRISSEVGTIYEHCIRAIEHAYKLGEHGIPLIGTGDWNDGMNMIGPKGKGESVWLGWFIYDVIHKFFEIGKIKNDEDFIEKYINKLKILKEKLNTEAWDGKWYKRAYFDNGQPVGSQSNVECRIDLISQAWSVISGGGEEEKVKMAMESVEKNLIDDFEKMILLLTPAFHRNKPNPGYIQGYLQGIRENGGQYTHAAIWGMIAFAKMGNAEKAYKLYNYLNPISHTKTHMMLDKYKLEPYVMPADIYYNKVVKGRGGWSWYTGSAGWMYNAGIEHLLGFEKVGDRVYLKPLFKPGWKSYSITYKYKKTTYRIEVIRSSKNEYSEKTIMVDQEKINKDWFELKDDKQNHQVVVTI